MPYPSGPHVPEIEADFRRRLHLGLKLRRLVSESHVSVVEVESEFEDEFFGADSQFAGKCSSTKTGKFSWHVLNLLDLLWGSSAVVSYDSDFGCIFEFLE
jgi:hypothetical protein